MRQSVRKKIYPVRNPIHYLANRILLRLYQASVVDTYGEIPISTLRKGGDQFVGILKHSLRLIEENDPRRFARVVRHVDLFVDCSHPGGAYSASYRHLINVVEIDFEYCEERGDSLFHAGYYAGVIVHEATHGKIRKFGIDTIRENRVQVERICRSEENRFLNRLNAIRPDLGNRLKRPFNPEDWHGHWHSSRLTRALRQMRRAKEKDKETSAQ